MTSSDTSPQLMQLCESEALCIFHKQMCIRDSISAYAQFSLACPNFS